MSKIYLCHTWEYFMWGLSWENNFVILLPDGPIVMEDPLIFIWFVAVVSFCRYVNCSDVEYTVILWLFDSVSAVVCGTFSKNHMEK